MAPYAISLLEGEGHPVRAYPYQTMLYILTIYINYKSLGKDMSAPHGPVDARANYGNYKCLEEGIRASLSDTET